MGARKRASSESSAQTTVNFVKPKSEDNSTIHSDHPPFSPSKAMEIGKLALIFLFPYTYMLLYHHRIDPALKRSILINAALSLAGFFVTLSLIPVASRYVLRRNLFGYDINKKDTPLGSVKVGLLSTTQHWPPSAS